MGSLAKLTMNSTHSTALAIGTIVVLLGLAIFGYARFSEDRPAPTNSNGSSTTTTSTSTSATSTAPATMTVKVAVLDTSGKGGVSRGCDTIAYVARTIPRTSAPLTASLKELFALETENVQSYYNFIAKTRSTLTFDRVTLENGVAKVYLNGRLSGLSGVCDDPRAAIQIEETAKQFSTVKSVELYLNGARTNLTPSEKGE